MPSEDERPRRGGSRMRRKSIPPTAGRDVSPRKCNGDRTVEVLMGLHSAPLPVLGTQHITALLGAGAAWPSWAGGCSAGREDVAAVLFIHCRTLGKCQGRIRWAASPLRRVGQGLLSHTGLGLEALLFSLLR